MDGLEPIEPHERALEVGKAQHLAVHPALSPNQGRVMLRLEVVNAVSLDERRSHPEQTGLERVAVVLLPAFEGSVDEDRTGCRMECWLGHGTQYSAWKRVSRSSEPGGMNSGTLRSSTGFAPDSRQLEPPCPLHNSGRETRPPQMGVHPMRSSSDKSLEEAGERGLIYEANDRGRHKSFGIRPIGFSLTALKDAS